MDFVVGVIKKSTGIEYKGAIKVVSKGSNRIEVKYKLTNPLNKKDIVSGKVSVGSASVASVVNAITADVNKN